MKKVAVIIAGGSGMGADSARALSLNGYNIAILSSTEKGKKLAEENKGIGFIGSNENETDIKIVFDEVIKKWGKVDVLVNSAGHGPRGPILELSDEDWHRGMEVYFLNVARASRIVTPIFLDQGNGGVIINISSFAAFEPNEIFPTSAVMRAGLASYTKLYTDKYASANIRMNNILPGFINSRPEKDEFRKMIPLGRYGKSFEEIASLVVFLSSPGGAYITGQNIRVDGGITRSV